MIVMKFGGTSLGDGKKIANVADIIKSRINEKPIVVVSAVGGITNKLIELGNESDYKKKSTIFSEIKKKHIEIIKELEIEDNLLEDDFKELAALLEKTKDEGSSAKVLDYYQSFGERMSSKLVAATLRKLGLKSNAYNSYEIGFTTDSNYGNAEIFEITYSHLSAKLNKLDEVPIITGFLGKDEKGYITTIGRGGSDYTAAIIGSALNVKEIQIWTDVNGILTADPRVVESAKTNEKVSFAEASELAYFGARVLHPKTILPAIEKNIPVRVLNTFNPDNKGTAIINKSTKNNNILKSIAYKKNITLINIGSTRMLGAIGFLAKLFSIFEKHKKSIDVISTSEISVSLTIDNHENIDNILNELRKIANVSVLENKSIICIVGEGMRNTTGIAGRTFSALGKNKVNIEMISQGASEINITFVVDSKDTEKAVKTLHCEYFES